MEFTFDQQKEYLLRAIGEESYLTEAQQTQLRDIVSLTQKQVVLDTVEDLLQRLLVQRIENSILIVRKIQNAVRLESRNKERLQRGTDTAAVEELLQQI